MPIFDARLVAVGGLNFAFNDCDSILVFNDGGLKTLTGKGFLFASAVGGGSDVLDTAGVEFSSEYSVEDICPWFTHDVSEWEITDPVVFWESLRGRLNPAELFVSALIRWTGRLYMKKVLSRSGDGELARTLQLWH